MSISKYEAASLYDFTTRNLTSEQTYLVIDLDDCSYGFCRCGGKSNIHLNSSWADGRENLWTLFMDSIKKRLGNTHIIDLEEEIDGQLLSANEAMQNYYLSDRALNGEAFSFSNIIIPCDELEEAVSIVKEKIVCLIAHAKDTLSAEKTTEQNIIILGKAQELFPIMYSIREQLSYDPWLPDERFRNTEFKDDYTEIVRVGKELYESISALKRTYSLLAFNPEIGKCEPVYSAPKGQTEMDSEKLAYSKSLLICSGDNLSIKADDSILDVALPYSFAPSRSDLIDVAIGVQNNEDTLFIRRCRFPTRIYNVKLV